MLVVSLLRGREIVSGRDQTQTSIFNTPSTSQPKTRTIISMSICENISLYHKKH